MLNEENIHGLIGEIDRIIINKNKRQADVEIEYLEVIKKTLQWVLDGDITGLKLHKKHVSKYKIIGKKFGYLTVLGFYDRSKIGKTKIKCKCDCGRITYPVLSSIKNGHIKSCGCVSERNLKHGFSKNSKFYKVWKGLRQRCNNKNGPNYKYYGARGITYDPRWENFEEFKKDMYLRYKLAEIKYKNYITNNNPLSIERRNVNGNYTKDNCSWILRSEQPKNRREYKGKRNYKGELNYGKK